MWRMRQKGKGYQADNSCRTPEARGRARGTAGGGVTQSPLPLVQGTFESRRYHQCRVTKYIITLRA